MFKSLIDDMSEIEPEMLNLMVDYKLNKLK